MASNSIISKIRAYRVTILVLCTLSVHVFTIVAIMHYHERELARDHEHFETRIVEFKQSIAELKEEIRVFEGASSWSETAYAKLRKD